MLLTEIVGNSLGILIEPAQVRLITGIDDPYTWKVLPGKEHLFGKHLSKHSIRAYMELWREVGISFEAVLATESTDFPQKKLQESTDAKLSFTVRINNLQTENTELNNQLNEWKNQAVRESELRKLAEEQASRLKIDNQQLQQDVQNLALMADYLRGIIIRSSQEINRVLEKLKSEVCSFSNRQDMSWVIPRDAFYGNQETK
jgi:Skp family chaperone for outer membrane proteins